MLKHLPYVRLVLILEWTRGLVLLWIKHTEVISVGVGVGIGAISLTAKQVKKNLNSLVKFSLI